MSAWRSRQSRANYSPENSLLTGKNTGNFAILGDLKCATASYRTHGVEFSLANGQKPNREFSRDIRESRFPDMRWNRAAFWWRLSTYLSLLPWVRRRESELFSLLDPVQRQAASQSLQAEIRRLPTVENGFHYVGWGQST